MTKNTIIINNNNKGRRYVRCRMSGMNTEYIIEFTTENRQIRHMIRELQQRSSTSTRRRQRRMDKHTYYYLVEEQYNIELENDMDVKHGRTYICKRKWV